MLAVVHNSVAKAPVELIAPDGGSPDSRCRGSEILSAYKKSYPDAVSMHFDGDSLMALSHEKQALLRPRYVWKERLTAFDWLVVSCGVGVSFCFLTLPFEVITLSDVFPPVVQNFLCLG